MPKIRCRGCETVLNAPDNARGKVIKCPKCSTKLKVPAGEAESAPQAPAKKKSPPNKQPKKQVSEDNFLGRLDAIDELDLEHDEEQICPYCASEMEDIEEDPVCRKCGMNVETGKMDAKEKKKRAIKGPDPALFYKEVWKNSWEFMWKEKGLAIRTGTNWMVFSVLCAMTWYMSYVFCKNAPPKVFWGSLAILTGLALPGWYWLLGLKIIRSTYLNEDVRSDRLNVDMFQSIASGIRAVVWPLILMLPIAGPLIIVLAVFSLHALTTGDPTILILVSSVVFLPSILVLPSAMVHMTAKYKYKGWIMWELVKVVSKVFVSTLFFLMVVFVCLLPVVLVAGPIFFLIKDINPFTSEVISGITHNMTMWLAKVADLGQVNKDSMYYTLIKGPFNIMFAFLVFGPIAYMAGFPAIFIMRANGLFGYYNQRALDLVEQISPNTPATFWVRYLAHTIDSPLVSLASFLVTANDKALMLQWFLNAVGLLVFFFSRPMFPTYCMIWPLYTTWLYWAVQEGSQIKTTLGKDAFGLIVVKEDSEQQITMGQASGRFALRIICDLLLGLPYFTAAFRKDKRTLHDIATKTRVVWKGDR